MLSFPQCEKRPSLLGFELDEQVPVMMTDDFELEMFNFDHAIPAVGDSACPGLEFLVSPTLHNNDDNNSNNSNNKEPTGLIQHGLVPVHQEAYNKTSINYEARVDHDLLMQQASTPAASSPSCSSLPSTPHSDLNNLSGETLASNAPDIELLLKPARKLPDSFVRKFPEQLYCHPYKYDLLIRWRTEMFEGCALSIELRHANDDAKVVMPKKRRRNSTDFHVNPAVEREGAKKRRRRKTISESTQAVEVESIRTIVAEGTSETVCRICFNVTSFYFKKNPFYLRVAFVSNTPEEGQAQHMKQEVTIGESRTEQFVVFARRIGSHEDCWAEETSSAEEQRKPQQQQQQQSSNKKRRAAYEPPEGAATKLSFQHALPQNRVFVNEAQNYYFASHNSKNCEEHKQPAAPQFQRPILLAPGASCPTPFSIEVLNVAELERQLSATTAQGLIPDFDIADFLANCIVNNDADTSSSTASAGISDSTDIFGASTTVFPLKLALQM